MTSKAKKHQPQTIPEIANRKECGTNIWDFRIRGFRVSNVEPQHTTIPEF
jgi:hypothetical protein